MATDKDIQGIFDMASDFAEKFQRRNGRAQDRFLQRYSKAVEKSFRDLEDTVVNMISLLPGDPNGILEDQRSIDFILAKKSRIKAIADRIYQVGKKYFLNEGSEIQQITQGQYEVFAKEARAQGLDYEFTMLNENQMRRAALQSVLLYQDFTGKLADEVSISLIRRIMGGATREKLVRDLKEVVPSIEKPKRGGGMFRLSAEERAKLIIRTETARLALQTTHAMNKSAWGNDYLVQNHNPLDERTSPECRRATEATEDNPMPVTKFASAYRMPPRHPRCRCAITALPKFLA